MPAYGSTDKVRRKAAEQYIVPARRRSESTVTIDSGEFNKILVQSNILPPNRFPIVCNALRSRKFLHENHLTLKEVKGPPSGQSSTVRFVYTVERLPPESAGTPPPTIAGDRFLSLRGIMRSAYKELGGAKAFHLRESGNWNK